MAFAKDIIGKKFGRLQIVSRNYEAQKEHFEKTGHYVAFWNAKCDCGNEKVVSGNYINLFKNKTNTVMSCGCYGNEKRHEQKNTKNIEWNIKGSLVYGKTNNNDTFVIDLDDFEKVKNYCWRKDPFGYIVAHARNGKNQIVRIHRVIMDAKPDEIVDHINWDKSDNRKSNLRIATKSQNNVNIKRRKNNRTGYTGVSLLKNGKYHSAISFNGVKYSLGNYANLDDAVKVRHKAEEMLHGEWSGEINRKDFVKFVKGSVYEA